MDDWYKQSFGHDYLIVYKHRDLQGAYHEVKRMIDWLQLPQGAEVLDLCCGMGRHSLALTDFGYKVTGIDLSEVLLEEAKKLDQDSTVKWLRADMREVPLDQPFDAVVNLFTSFGYFEQDSENQKVLNEINRLLKPGGKFIIDFLNPSVVSANLVPYSERTEGDLTIQESRSIIDGFVRKRIVIREAGTVDREYLEQVKLYEKAQFEGILEEAKLQVHEVYGNYDGSPYDAKLSPRMIFVGKKKGSTHWEGSKSIKVGAQP